ncbi:hypothetical protein [Phytobacter sp. V91]|uniref:hypothetical protein n=1 Tax=Phytobacter sp. V91 TaxID=3369425 RepID=UPI003F5E69CF
MKIFRSLIVSGVFFLSACNLLSPKAIFTPKNNKLKSASVGTPYFAKIDIIGGAVMGGWYHQKPDYKAGTVTPSDAGISLRNCLLPEEETGFTLPQRPIYNGNCVEIYGTPNKTGKVSILRQSRRL